MRLPLGPLATLAAGHIARGLSWFAGKSAGHPQASAMAQRLRPDC